MKWIKTIFLIIFFVCLSVIPCSAVEIIGLTWLPNIESNLKGYKIYLQDIHNPGQMRLLKTVNKNISRIDILSFTIPTDGTWQLVMTAFNTADIEGPYSKPAIDISTKKIALWNIKGTPPNKVRGLTFE